MVCRFRLLNVLLALAVALAPLWPAAMTSAMAATAFQAVDHSALHATPPANDAGDSVVDDGTVAGDAGCEQHQGCDGQCCVACAHCFTAALSAASTVAPARSVQSATGATLHPSPYVFPPNRPPQAI